MYWNFLETYNPLHNCSTLGKHCNKLSTPEFLLYQFTFMLHIVHRKMFKLTIKTNCPPTVQSWSEALAMEICCAVPVSVQALSCLENLP